MYDNLLLWMPIIGVILCKTVSAINLLRVLVINEQNK
jgi:hypothetical protein